MSSHDRTLTRSSHIERPTLCCDDACWIMAGQARSPICLGQSVYGRTASSFLKVPGRHPWPSTHTHSWSPGCLRKTLLQIIAQTRLFRALNSLTHWLPSTCLLMLCWLEFLQHVSSQTPFYQLNWNPDITLQCYRPVIAVIFFIRQQLEMIFTIYLQGDERRNRRSYNRLM
jgi:hypothetical protein